MTSNNGMRPPALPASRSPQAKVSPRPMRRHCSYFYQTQDPRTLSSTPRRLRTSGEVVHKRALAPVADRGNGLVFVRPVGVGGLAKVRASPLGAGAGLARSQAVRLVDDAGGDVRRVRSYTGQVNGSEQRWWVVAVELSAALSASGRSNDRIESAARALIKAILAQR